MKNKIILGIAVAGFIATEVQKFRILLKQEEKIQSIFKRERTFADHITTNNFAIDDIEGQLNDLGQELDRLDKQKEDKTLKPKKSKKGQKKNLK